MQYDYYPSKEQDSGEPGNPQVKLIMQRKAQKLGTLFPYISDLLDSSDGKQGFRRPIPATLETARTQ